MNQNVHKYSGYVLIGTAVALVAQSVLSDDLLQKALGVLFVLSAAANYFTAEKPTTPASGS